MSARSNVAAVRSCPRFPGRGWSRPRGYRSGREAMTLAGLIMALACGWCGQAVGGGQVAVSEELSLLMKAHGFEVRGLEQTEDAIGRAEGDDLVARLRLLLEGFDHVILQTGDGGVERIIILGEKVPYIPPPPLPPYPLTEIPGTAAEPDPEGVVAGEAPESPGSPETEAPLKAEIVLGTQRSGATHAVNLVLEGPQGQRVQRLMLVDTGADRVVLPDSLIGPLGLQAGQLRQHSVQTANGLTMARLGTLAAIWLGEARVPNVEVAFIEDGRLGGQALLGMSVLGRFRVTIDDAGNRLTLERR